MGQPWLDDLSEEWIPQPTSAEDKQDANSPLSPQVSQSVPPKLRSRLPRMRHSSASFSDLQLRQVAKDLKPPKRRSALIERALSDNNIPTPISPDTPNDVASRHTSRSFSVASLGSVVHDGTVAQKAVPKAPAPDRPSHETPEWRRRLLKGDIGYGDQKDLFSPMGLENIFQKPSDEPSEDIKQGERKVGLFKGLAAMPSSPPPWSSTEQQAEDEDASAHDPRRKAVLDKAGFHEYSDDKQLGKISVSSQGDGPRTVSGQIEFENENFSPVYLSTKLEVAGASDSAPNFRGSELAQRLRHLGSPPPNQGPKIVLEEQTPDQSQQDSSFSKIQDDSLPGDLPAGTPDLAEMGRFVELRRGGYSRDGSFRRRPLSPSPRSKVAARSKLEDELTHEGSTPANLESDDGIDYANESGQTQIPPHPTTPHREERSKRLSPERAKSSTSPLKLFDAHDTFTSNRLHRRLSQLEYKSETATSSTVQISKTESTKLIQKASRLTSVEEVSIQGIMKNAAENQQIDHPRLETFGQGRLNEYRFTGEFTGDSSQLFCSHGSTPIESPSMDIAPPGSRRPLTFHLDRSPISREPSRTKRQGLTRVSNPFHSTSHTIPHPNPKSPTTTSALESELQYECAEGKRGPTSPFKNPTPKRRRTIHSVDEGEGPSDIGLKPIQHSHAAIQSVIGRKRKDARHDHSNNVAEPEVLARRHILRPRNPTPSQRRKDEIHAEIIEATEAFMLSSPKLNTIREQLQSPVRSVSEETRATIVANEVAAFSMTRAHGTRDETRKRSVTTQDFLDEAVKIMDFIRAKGRPTSGLGSLEETEAESVLLQPESDVPSTPLTFDRPPSREGRLSAWREPNKRELDANVISHLRKYQERESDDFMGSSIRSLRFGMMDGPIPTESDGNSVVVEQDGIRITDNRDRHHTARAIEDDRVNSQPRTVSTHPSTASSVGQTVVTNTSRRSDHVATLAPEAVAHLIPEQVAGMSFDRQKNMWVRQKGLSKEHHPTEYPGANESEDDPFGNIPDLSVDELAELQMNNASPSRPQATAETFLEDTEVFEPEDEVRPVTREGKATTMTDTSSVPSKVSNFAWSFPKTETRATSWSDQETRNGDTQKPQQFPTTYAIPESDEDDVEHEIQYFEGRGTVKPAMQSTKVRDITISIAERDFGTKNEPEPEMSTPNKYWQKLRDPNVRHNAHMGAKAWPPKSAKTLPRTRPHLYQEDRELSILEDLPTGNYRMQVSMSVSRPNPGPAEREVLVSGSSPMKGDVTFMLSDLPDFTLNQIDECELPDRVIVKHDGAKFSKALEDRYALGTAELVKALQDAEPDEPYWEDLREVNLRNKCLTNLHRLEEFCHRLENLDVSDNSINQVEGIPFTIRRLSVQNNHLTSLTSWSTLMNLQHLDISGNDIDSLDGLSELLHLRTLKADDNNIQSLGGISHLDGIMELSASGNSIQAVDFARTNLKSLTDLNLRGNGLFEVRNIGSLSQLQHLDLDDNCIDEFPLVDKPTERCNALRSLRLCANRLTSMNVDRYFPKLESLYLDGNALIQVSGLEHLRRLKTFSARGQRLRANSESEACVGNLIRNADVRNLYISLNSARSLDLSQHLLNLQRLELASMGLKELPNDFGQLTPNLRTVNLNFNSIKDLRPLLNIKRLNELFLAGNKIDRLRTNATVLGRLGTLTKLDWRDNPLTFRFYAPHSENRIMSLRRKPSDEQTTDRFVLPDGDVKADEQYLARLDNETKIRRRVSEMMLAHFCKSLQELDGLPFDTGRILVRDDVWERLLSLGVIHRKPVDKSAEDGERRGNKIMQ
ncbi:hypothetical protein BDV95DRAFT_552449 [Massariosphaeria phaeospora]|uniref:Septation initiation network scaffold protein cdc11 n=1 Tax=Massariosphaeria phaeospora TaxID=100035 RepID=A0A7C8I390_9PLEO|nr:hypothetical protein BDV95DRAFT_552449 [Massariosphaeria phaeospora]